MKYLLLLFLTMGCFREPTIKEMMGPDKDGNGVRDDIDEYINDVTKDEDERNAFKQYAKYLRLGFKYYQDKDASIRNTKKELLSFSCVTGIWKKNHPGYRESLTYRKILNHIENNTFDGLKTLKVKSTITGHFSGQVIALNDKLDQICKFKLRKKY